MADAEIQRLQESTEFPIAAGILFGLGLGGFFDGIVLHQILQWHHMVSSTSRWNTESLHGLKANTLGDGLFHAGTWIVTLAGIAILWRVLADRDHPVVWSHTAFGGLLLLGWGLFNLVEGLIDHQILGIHHVRSGANHLWYDLGFLAWGSIMLLVGWQLARSGWHAEAGDRLSGRPSQAEGRDPELA
jgi:uncharacterized membrane protein